MTLKAEFNINIPEMVDISLLNVELIFEKSKYVKKINRLDGQYEIIFSWKKFGTTRDFPVHVNEFRGDQSLLIESTANSKFKFKLGITATPYSKNNEQGTNITITAEMGAGILADLFGENDFRNFIKNSTDQAIKTYAILVDGKRLELVSGKKEVLKSIELEQILPPSLVEKIINGNWTDANQEITCMLSKNIDDLNLWLVKAYVSEKCNLSKLAEIYLDYIVSKDKKILDSKLAKLLAEDFKSLESQRSKVLAHL